MDTRADQAALDPAFAKTGRKGKLRFGLGTGIFFVLTLWYVWDIFRTLVFSLQSQGIAGLIDSVLMFRAGESLIVIPASAALLVSTNKPLFIKHTRWVIWTGVILSALAYPGLTNRVVWAPQALITSGIGLLLPFSAYIRSKWTFQIIAWVGLVSLLLVHLGGFAAGFLFHGYPVLPYPGKIPAITLDRNERWQQDIQYLRSELTKLHKNVFHTVPEDEFMSQVARLESAIPMMSDQQIALELNRIVASVGDAHTEYAIGDSIPLHILPVDLGWFKDGLYVRGAGEAYPEIVGAKVTKIGSMTAEEAYRAVLPYISHENESWARVKSSSYLNVMEYLTAGGVIEESGSASFTVSDGQDRIFTVNISPLDSGEKIDYLTARQETPFYLSKPDLPFWYEYRENTQTLYFRYASCTDLLEFRTLMRELWEDVDNQPIERLIVDLRGNGGGNSMQFERWFGGGLHKRAYLNDPDKLFVLIDKRTFSSASDNAVFMRAHTRATFIGEPTGGKPNSYGEVRSFRLPNSRGRIYYSTNYFMLVGGEDPSSVEPDIVIAPLAEEYFNGRDPVLEFIVPGETWQ